MSSWSRFIAFVVLILVIVSITSMSLFKFFNKKSEVDQTKGASPVPTHKEDWAVFLTTIDNDKVGSIMVDIGLKNIAPIPQRPHRLVVDIQLLVPSDNGLPNDKEFSVLGEMEETLQTKLVNQREAIFAGHLYCEGTMSLYFYLSHPGNSQTIVKEAMTAFPNYTYQTRINSEDNWETYLEFLFPMPIQMQSIQNGKLIQQIAGHGDPLEKVRQVDHWIYFPTEDDRKKFLSVISGKGFKIENEGVNESSDGKPFQLHISRLDKITPEAVDKYTLELWQIAHDCNGDYDGWETFIVKD